jgi:hypothetical protein
MNLASAAPALAEQCCGEWGPPCMFGGSGSMRSMSGVGGGWIRQTDERNSGKKVHDTWHRRTTA